MSRRHWLDLSLYTYMHFSILMSMYITHRPAETDTDLPQLTGRGRGESNTADAGSQEFDLLPSNIILLCTHNH